MKHNYFPLINHWKINMSLLSPVSAGFVIWGWAVMYHPLTPGQSWVQSPVSFRRDGRERGGQLEKKRENNIAGDRYRHLLWMKQGRGMDFERESKQNRKEVDRWTKWMKHREAKRDEWLLSSLCLFPSLWDKWELISGCWWLCVSSQINLLNTLLNGSLLKSKASYWLGEWVQGWKISFCD